ncbi:hypothetical protein BOX15_Mlig015386g1, partial [Macrostomum lignano]
PRCVRQRVTESSSESEDESATGAAAAAPDGQADAAPPLSRAEEMRLLLEAQRMRSRPHGLTDAELVQGVRRQRTRRGLGDEDDVGGKRRREVGGIQDSTLQFAQESRAQEQDAAMQQFVEAEMRKRRPAGEGDDDGASGDSAAMHDPLLAVRPELRPTVKQQSEASQAVLQGIPEVDLGIQARIRNIEATEEAKQKMLNERAAAAAAAIAAGGRPDLVPANLASNFQSNATEQFVQHQRWRNRVSGPFFRRRDVAAAARPSDNRGGGGHHRGRSRGGYAATAGSQLTSEIRELLELKRSGGGGGGAGGSND